MDTDNKKSCSLCKRTSLPPEAFILYNKSYKTCARCLLAKSKKKAEKRSLPSDNNFEGMNNRTESQLEKNMEEITFNNIIEYISNKISDLEEDSSISFNLRIELDDNTLTNAHNNTKLLVKLIVDEIEEGDGFTTGPTNSVRHFEYRELERDYKESNRKRMDRFDCHGKLIIGVDIAAKEAKVKLSHNIQHEKPVDVTTPEEIKREIMQNLSWIQCS
ncbi:hypothetical protein C2G38_2263281 [Gigaspora rosea]|uniref:Uncharacterized protein n=1 Tax=Gigaspora rosea TaxID=44941 RepID=A0A397UNN7_9GLOM|nr:hypothetical protein C2G38_2263281 [Gigaspora rosea]